MTSNEKCNRLLERVTTLITSGIIRNQHDIERHLPLIISSSLMFQGLRVLGVEKMFDTLKTRVLLHDDEHDMYQCFHLSEQLFYHSVGLGGWGSTSGTAGTSGASGPSGVSGYGPYAEQIKDKVIWPEGLFDFEGEMI